MKAFISGRHVWWKRPEMNTDADSDIERKASWLELFWDLVFVAVISQFSRFLHVNNDMKGIAEFAFLFVPIWWIWNGVTFYNERYEMNNVRHRLLMFISMIPIAGMVCSIPQALGSMAAAFALCNMMSRLLLIYMWLTAGTAPIEKKLSVYFSIGSLISATLFAVSVFLPSPYMFYVWALAIVADLATPLFTLKLQAKLPKISTSHLPERFGLLVILTLGETVIGTLNSLPQLSAPSLLTVTVAIESLLVSFMIWWLYTDHVMYRVFKPGILPALSWCYLHLPIAICIIALSAVQNGMIASVTIGHASADLLWQLPLFTIMILLIIALLGRVSESNDRHHGIIDFHQKLEKELLQYKLYGAGFILIIILSFGKMLSHAWLLFIIIIGFSIPIMQGLSVWVKAHLKNKTLIHDTN
ncbi:MAG TPA: low temperature requirement protein A [Ferruginibacter sp.]|nr:low temperature requirement protein A [Ferruginibacter sp.]